VHGSASSLEDEAARAHTAFSFRVGGRSSSRLAELVHPDSPLALEAIAARTLALPPTEPDETPYQGVSCQLHEPIARASRHAPARSASEAVATLRFSMEMAVERSLGDADRVAVMAGGGLDSAGLLALAVEWARPRGATVFAVALDYAAAGDDRPYMRILEAALGCEVLRVRPEEGAQHLGMTGVDGAPFCWPSGPMEMEMMARARAHGAKRVLMGVGGDEIFDGQPQALAAVAGRGELRKAIRASRALRGFERPRSRTASWLLRPLVARHTPPAVRLALARRKRVWAPEWAGPSLREYLESIHVRDLEALAHNLGDGIIVDPKHAERHRANIAWLRHQEEIVAGIERHDPYLDRALVATIAGFQPEWLLEGAIRRGLFRAALRGLLPDALLEREDKAYFEPAFARMIAAAGGLESFRELASARELAELELVDPARFGEAFEAFVRAPDDGWSWMSIWPAICVEQFLRARRPTPSQAKGRA
jgi:asparagine synthase (glutamine-hydrolysing)